MDSVGTGSMIGGKIEGYSTEQAHMILANGGVLTIQSGSYWVDALGADKYAIIYVE